MLLTDLRIPEAPSNSTLHDFSDPYCRDPAGVKLCKHCGVGQAFAPDAFRCEPDPHWRARNDYTVATQQAEKDRPGPALFPDKTAPG